MIKGSTQEQRIGTSKCVALPNRPSKYVKQKLKTESKIGNLQLYWDVLD